MRRSEVLALLAKFIAVFTLTFGRTVTAFISLWCFFHRIYLARYWVMFWIAR